jgi:hypothetical protein
MPVEVAVQAGLLLQSWGLGGNGTANSVKHFFAVPTELPIRPDVPIKGLARHPKLPAKIADVGFNLPHR